MTESPIMPMAPVATARYARPNLTLVPRDTIVAAVEALDTHLDPEIPDLQGEVMEISGPALCLFRFATDVMRRPLVLDIPTDICTPKVRGHLYDLLVALEEAESKRAAAHASAVGLTILPAS